MKERCGSMANDFFWAAIEGYEPHSMWSQQDGDRGYLT